MPSAARRRKSKKAEAEERKQKLIHDATVAALGSTWGVPSLLIAVAALGVVGVTYVTALIARMMLNGVIKERDPRALQILTWINPQTGMPTRALAEAFLEGVKAQGPLGGLFDKWPFGGMLKP